MEISKNFGGNSSSPILSARKRQTSTFHCISRGISERSFSLALESVHIHFLEGWGSKTKRKEGKNIRTSFESFPGHSWGLPKSHSPRDKLIQLLQLIFWMSKTKFSVQRHFLDISWGSQKTNNTDQKSCWFCWHVIRCFYFCYLEQIIEIQDS